MSHRWRFIRVVSATALGLMAACSNSTAPLDQFQPQINNVPDNFQFQATGVTNVTTTLNYNWQNSGTGASINQSTTVTAGSATVTIYDANNVQVYTRSLADNGTFPASTGTTGTWRIKVVFVNYDGTVNFRVQKA